MRCGLDDLTYRQDLHAVAGLIVTRVFHIVQQHEVEWETESLSEPRKCSPNSIRACCRHPHSSPHILTSHSLLRFRSPRFSFPSTRPSVSQFGLQSPKQPTVELGVDPGPRCNVAQLWWLRIHTNHRCPIPHQLQPLKGAMGFSTSCRMISDSCDSP